MLSPNPEGKGELLAQVNQEGNGGWLGVLAAEGEHNATPNESWPLGSAVPPRFLCTVLCALVLVVLGAEHGAALLWLCRVLCGMLCASGLLQFAG